MGLDLKLDAIGIACKDIQETIRFYQIFELSFEKSGDDHYEATTSTGLRIMLDSVALMKKINPNWHEPVGSNITLCFKQNNADHVNKLYEKITSEGFEGVKEPWDAFWGQRYSSVKDPNGNQIDIFCDL